MKASMGGQRESGHGNRGPTVRSSLGPIAALLLAYWLVAVRGLDVVPPVYEDEPWQASTGWKLAEQGVFGSDMFLGYYGMERHYYGYMPMHPFLLAAMFRLAGLGLFQARLEAVTLGLVTLALTYALGRRLFGAKVGLLAVGALLFVRTAGLTRVSLSGILFLDTARIARYDMAVPVFGLACLHAYLTARRTKRERFARHLRWYFGAGFLAGLSGLSHLYGLFWLAVLLFLAAWEQAGWKEALAILCGFGAPWLAYVAYVLSGWTDWVGQTRGYAPRLGLLQPRWYFNNLLAEPSRYGPGLGPPGWGYLLRPGFWAAALGIPGALIGLGGRAKAMQPAGARAILVPALVFPLLFALLITLKLSNYLVTVIPIWAVAGGWGLAIVWENQRGLKRGRWRRAVILALSGMVFLEGLSRIWSLQVAARAASPYSAFIAAVREHIPEEARVLGLQNYWFGLQDRDYRAWPVPLFQTDPSYRPQPLTLEEALDRLAPEVILLDPRIRAYFQQDANVGREAYEWMDSRGYLQVAVIEDPTYGRMEVHRLEP